MAGGVASETWDTLQTALIQIATAAVVYGVTYVIDRIRQFNKESKNSKNTYKPD